MKRFLPWSTTELLQVMKRRLPEEKKIKTPGGGAGASNLAHEFAQYIDNNYSGQHQGVSPVRQKTKVNDPSFFSPSEHSNPIKDSE
jgi:hypothetical protein